MSWTNNIQRLREAKDWSRPELGKRMGTSGQQVERLEKGQRRLSQEWIEKAAEALGVKPATIIAPEPELVAGGYLKNVPANPAGITSDILPTRDASAGDDMVEIGALDLSFSMGPGTTLDDYIEETPVRFDLGFIRSITRTPPHRLRLAKGVGDSMFPTLLTSDRVMIDTTQRALNLGDRVYAVSLYGAAAIKRLRTVSQSKVLVISDNPNVPDQEVEAEDVVIAGRVIWFARDL